VVKVGDVDTSATAVPALRARDVTKAYGGVPALRSASFEVCSGEIHALVGENGAGKSTLIRVLTGAVVPDGGTVWLGERDVTGYSPAEARAAGVAAIYQQPALFPTLTVEENIGLATEGGSPWRLVDWRTRRARANELLARVGARIDPTAEAGTLSMPEQQLVEIARALGADARVLILDEPTASLSEEDTVNLFRLLRALRAQGVGIIYISHRLEELPLIADRVTVLRDGRTVDTQPMASVDRAMLIRMMVGRDVTTLYPKRDVPLGDPVLRLTQLGCDATGVRNVSLDVRAGEIVGLAGLVGAGRTELARTLFGITPATTGTIEIGGRRVQVTSPAAAMALGIAYLPEDRRRHGVVPGMSIRDNVTLASLPAMRTRGLGAAFHALDTEREIEVTLQYVEQLGIKARAVHDAVSTLSGGNQQKVALARWLLRAPRALVLDEPTQGVDVGAKSEIHALIGELAARGVAILLISSELPEILGMSDRILVMHDRTPMGIVNRADATPESLLAMALGHTPAAVA
jgi:rhamnose transport system ATP-binding protein